MPIPAVRPKPPEVVPMAMATDARRAEIQAEFADPAIYDNRRRVETLKVELKAVERKAETALAAWETALAAVEGY